MTEKEAANKVKEFGLYHAIGDLPCSAITVKAFEMAIKALEEIQQYRAIGTVEECREARERQIPKKLIHGGLYACPNCHTIMLQGAFEAKGKYCKECGQVLDWSETV